MTVHYGKLDIFNLSRKPGGNHPEIGEFMTKAFEARDKYKNVFTKGSFIELEKLGDTNDQIIAFARHYKGKTMIVVANKNIDREVAAVVKVPTLKADQDIKNILPSYGKESILQAAAVSYTHLDVYKRQHYYQIIFLRVFALGWINLLTQLRFIRQKA